MPLSLRQYIDELASRSDVRWPAPPPPDPLPAKAVLKPLGEVRLVVWGVYGTLLRVADGELLFSVPSPLRMEVALDKTIKEFNFWNSMSRKPGAPWEYFKTLYDRTFDDMRMLGSAKRGETVEVNSSVLWRKLLGKLDKKDYSYDQAKLGDLDELALKVAYFFHASLQGVGLAPSAPLALQQVADLGIRQTLFGNFQPFSPAHLNHLVESASASSVAPQWIPAPVGSAEIGVRAPAKTVVERLASECRSLAIAPHEVLVISSRLNDDLGPAKAWGAKTVLVAGDRLGLQATNTDLRSPELKPEGLLTDLGQVGQLLMR